MFGLWSNHLQRFGRPGACEMGDVPLNPEMNDPAVFNDHHEPFAPFPQEKALNLRRHCQGLKEVQVAVRIELHLSIRRQFLCPAVQNERIVRGDADKPVKSLGCQRLGVVHQIGNMLFGANRRIGPGNTDHQYSTLAQNLLRFDGANRFTNHMGQGRRRHKSSRRGLFFQIYPHTNAIRTRHISVAEVFGKLMGTPIRARRI